MPPKLERLTKHDFSRLTKRTTFVSSLFDIVYILSPIKKVGCILSKKRAPKAKDRNKIKRKIYHIYKEYTFKKACIIIFYPKKEIIYAPYKKIREEMFTLFATLQ